MQLQFGNHKGTVRQDGSARVREHPLEGRWAQTRDQFLSAVDPRQRPTVAGLLRQPHRGGVGLRMWLRTLVTQGRAVPESLPLDLVQVYLDDPEAVPLHDCAECGLAIPVHPGWRGYEGEPERVYFPACPCCGGPTGLHAYWSKTTKY